MESTGRIQRTSTCFSPHVAELARVPRLGAPEVLPLRLHLSCIRIRAGEKGGLKKGGVHRTDTAHEHMFCPTCSGTRKSSEARCARSVATSATSLLHPHSSRGKGGGRKEELNGQILCTSTCFAPHVAELARVPRLGVPEVLPLRLQLF